MLHLHFHVVIDQKEIILLSGQGGGGGSAVVVVGHRGGCVCSISMF